MNVKVDLEAVIRIPPIPFNATLAAHIPMSGMKIVPCVYWDDLAKRIVGTINNDWRKLRPNLEEFGFKFYEHHLRSESHDTWQYTLAERHPGAWVIPIDELICVYYNDPKACDFVSINRAVFEGTEEELCDAIIRFCQSD